MESESDVAGSYKKSFNIFNASIKSLKCIMMKAQQLHFISFAYEAIIFFSLCKYRGPKLGQDHEIKAISVKVVII